MVSVVVFYERRRKNGLGGGGLILQENEEFQWRIGDHDCRWWPSCVVES